jgi:F0F1-type ATP synthase assembly protein I
MSEPGEQKRNTYAQIARYTELGFIIPAAVLVGWLFGALLARWLGMPWLKPAGIILGTIAGFVQMIRMAMSAANEQR